MIIIQLFQISNLPGKRKKVSNRIEMYNLKNTENQKVFREITSNNDNLSSIFDKKDLNEATNLFLKKLEENIKVCFKKIRISDKQNKEIEELFFKRKELRNKTDLFSKIELEKVETKLANLCAQANYKKICEEISDIKCDEGGINSGKLWKLKKKLSPKCRDPPTAMMDFNGKLLTSEEEIQKLAIKVFENRLRNRDMKTELSDMKKDKESLCKMRLEIAQKKQNTTMDTKRVRKCAKIS